MQTWLNSLADILSVWTVTRAAGMASYLLLFLSVAAGLLQGESWAKGPAKVRLNFLHQWSGWFGLLFGIVHGLVLTFDNYTSFSFIQVLIPFTAAKEPFWTGIGTISLYMLLLLLASSDLMKQLGKKVWRAIHYVALPTYLLALIHGVMLGTDSHVTFVQLIYIVTGLSVATLVARKIYSARRRQKGKPVIVN